MSRSNPTLTNPAQHFMSWSGSTGTLSWYNKETQANIPVKLPFKFLVLDQLATIKGYNKQSKMGFYSNEVRNTRKEELTIRSKQGIVYTGFYKNEQDIVMVPKGAEYTQSVYIAHKVGDNWVLGNVNMKGSSRSAWFDFTKTCKVENGSVTMTKGPVQQAQTGDFYPPVFSYESSTTEENTEAIRLDKELQIYLSQYLAANKHDTDESESDAWPSHEVDQSVGLATPEQQADYDQKRGKQHQLDDAEFADFTEGMAADGLSPQELEELNNLGF